jgi:hypothetical protein
MCSFTNEFLSCKIMNKTLSIMFGLLLVLFAWVSAYPQSSTTKKDYKVISSDYDTTSEKKVLLTDYNFKGSTIKTIEKYFDDRETQDEGLKAAAKNFTGCGPQTDIFNRARTILGRKIVCEDIPAKAYIIAYSHFDSLNKVYVISGTSRRIVEQFVTECPFEYHLHPDNDCPGSD